MHVSGRVGDRESYGSVLLTRSIRQEPSYRYHLPYAVGALHMRLLCVSERCSSLLNLWYAPSCRATRMMFRLYIRTKQCDGVSEFDLRVYQRPCQSAIAHQWRIAQIYIYIWNRGIISPKNMKRLSSTRTIHGKRKSPNVTYNLAFPSPIETRSSGENGTYVSPFTQSN